MEARGRERPILSTLNIEAAIRKASASGKQARTESPTPRKKRLLPYLGPLLVQLIVQLLLF